MDELSKERVEAIQRSAFHGTGRYSDNDIVALCTMALRAIDGNHRGEECICANRAKVESMVHPYCPRHAGGDPGPGIGACESCDGPEQPAVVVVGVGTRSATRLCLDCLLAHALNVTTQRDSALAELAAARAAMPTAEECDAMHNVASGRAGAFCHDCDGKGYINALGFSHKCPTCTGRAGGGGHE